MSDWTVAEAFDFFGLFGSDDKPPEVSRAAISYALTVEVAGDPSGLKDAVRDASSLYSLRKDAPPDGEALARRAQSDFAPVIDALWGAGYYNASVTIAIDGASPRHRLERHRSLLARRRGLSQSRSRPGRHQGRARPLVQAAHGARCRRAWRGIPGSRPAAAHRRPQAGRPGGGERDPRRSNPHRRLLPQARAPAGQNPVRRAGRRSRPGHHGRDDHGGPRPHRAVRRSDDQGAADFRSRDRALVSLYPSGRPLFAGGDRRRAEQHPRNSGGRRRAHHRGDDARRLRSAALSDRRRGPPALRFRRVDEIFDDERARGPGLLGRPQCVRRRRAPAPAGRRLLCAALVHLLAKSPTLLVRRYRRARIGKLSQTRLVGDDQRPPDRRAWRRR